MLLRSVVKHVREQNWFAVGLDFFIVVVGVFIGLQVSNWNEARSAEQRRDQVKAILITDLRDATEVQDKVIFLPIQQGLADWQTAFERGEQPPPYSFRLHGSDTPPDTWGTLQQEQLSRTFDPVTLFDLGYYYSELHGSARKYIRYVTFVESGILPKLKQGTAVFYTTDGSQLLPEYDASMDRLREFAAETNELRQWAECLLHRIEAARSFDGLCRRSNYQLEGMDVLQDGME
ncbi:hypothetical protein BH23GEM3_BH23GEM3_02680 [soil metagenome]